MKDQNTDKKREFVPSEEAQLALNALKRAAEKVEKEEVEAEEWAAYKASKSKTA